MYIKNEKYQIIRLGQFDRIFAMGKTLIGVFNKYTLDENGVVRLITAENEIATFDNVRTTREVFEQMTESFSHGIQIFDITKFNT